jgi:hypothetical protein
MTKKNILQKIAIEYRNSSNNSGVVQYETTPDDITIEFKDGSKYVYDKKTPGRYKVNKMKNLAKRGFGLNTYINKRIKSAYKTKLV